MKKSNLHLSFELRVSRVNELPATVEVLDTPCRVVEFWNSTIAAAPWYDPERECVVAILLNTRFRPFGHSLVSVGTLNESIVHPRDVFRPAIAGGAYGVVLVHNHPSGDTTPSSADLRITKRLTEGGTLLQVPFLDSIIIGRDNTYYSFREAGLL